MPDTPKSPLEWITWPLEARRRVAMLDKQWEELLDAIVGDGPDDAIPELADMCRAEFRQYANWRDTITGITWAWSIVDELEEYTRRANGLARMVKGSGNVAPAELPEWGGKGEEYLRGLAGGIQNAAITAAALGIAALTVVGLGYVVLTARKR